jgi:hypothetical protein
LYLGGGDDDEGNDEDMGLTYTGGSAGGAVRVVRRRSPNPFSLAALPALCQINRRAGVVKLVDARDSKS